MGKRWRRGHGLTAISMYMNLSKWNVHKKSGNVPLLTENTSNTVYLHQLSEVQVPPGLCVEQSGRWVMPEEARHPLRCRFAYMQSCFLSSRWWKIPRPSGPCVWVKVRGFSHVERSAGGQVRFGQRRLQGLSDLSQLVQQLGERRPSERLHLQVGEKRAALWACVCFCHFPLVEHHVQFTASPQGPECDASESHLICYMTKTISAILLHLL